MSDYTLQVRLLSAYAHSPRAHDYHTRVKKKNTRRSKGSCVFFHKDSEDNTNITSSSPRLDDLHDSITRFLGGRLSLAPLEHTSPSSILELG
jgi:hypothetical protein